MARSRSRPGARAASAALGMAAAAWLALLAGCSVPPYPGTPEAAAQAARKPASAGQPAGRTTDPASAQPVSDADVPVPGTMTPAPSDSGPSPAARAVLNSIPEPGGADPEPGDSASEGEAGVPTPSETRPLGDRPEDMVDSTSTPAAPPDPASTAPGTSPPEAPASAPAQAPPSSTAPDQGTPSAPAAGTAPASGPCWRVQFGAPESAEEAETVRAAAASQLVIVITVEQDGKYYKIRSADCLDREGAVKLRERATASGFEDAFLVRGNTR